MSEIQITYKGKKYPVKEPTIETWSEIMKHRDLMDEAELFVKTLELLTDLTEEQILEADAEEIYIAGETIISKTYSNHKKVFNEIKHKDIDYVFLNIQNVSFGQFIDIDTFLGKNDNYKQSNLHELAAYLYTEKGYKYGETSFEHRKEAFRDLPMKYLDGAVFFLASSAKTLGILTKIYSQSKILRTIARIKIISLLIGDGIQLSVHSVRTRFGYLVSLLAYPLLSVSIILLTFWTLIRSKKKNIKN